jgi:beta-xylosidase
VSDFIEEMEQISTSSTKFGTAEDLKKYKDLLQYSSMNKKFIFQKTA